MFLLFNVGLEVKASELMRVGGTAFLVASAGVIVPFVVGWGILAAWGAPNVEAIFVGAAMVATSVGITASVLSARGLLNEIASKIILTAAVIDDVLGLIVLAAVSAIARGRLSILDLTLTAALAAAFTVVMGVWGFSRTSSRVHAPRRPSSMLLWSCCSPWRCWRSTRESRPSWGRFWRVWHFPIAPVSACGI
jgi:Kef-type K+ transport system membrane component KefB